MRVYMVRHGEAAAQKAAAQRVEFEKAVERGLLAARDAISSIREGIPTETSVVVMVALIGALGGSLHFIRSLTEFIGNRRLKRSWLLYCPCMPITGAGLALIVYMLLRTGILSPAGNTTDGSAVANLNLIAIYAFAALTGLFAKTALDKLHEVFATIFRTQGPSSRDAIDSEAASSAGSGTTDA